VLRRSLDVAPSGLDQPCNRRSATSIGIWSVNISIQQDSPDDQTAVRRAHVLGSHQAYILERWNDGCQNSRRILTELIARLPWQSVDLVQLSYAPVQSP